MPLMQLDASQLYIIAPDCPPILRGGALRRAGTTGAEVQIQYAIDMLRALGMGGVVKLSPGNFTIDAPIKLYEGIHLEGSGMYTTQLILNGAKYCDMVQHVEEYEWEGVADTSYSTYLTNGTHICDAGVTWVTDTEADDYVDLKTRYVFIYEGTGAGQREAITAFNDHSITFSGTMTIAPDNTSKYRIGATQQLFMGIRDMTLNGNKANNAAYTGATTSATANTLVRSGGNAWVANRWNEKAVIEILTGTGAGQCRRIISNTTDTVTIDGPWKTTPDATSTYVIGGCGISMYGPSSYDLMLLHVWTSFCAVHGVYAEEIWGHCYDDLISEFNAYDGVRTALGPFQRGTTATAAWTPGGAGDQPSAGVVPTTGPKLNLCKLVANGRHGLYLGNYVYNTIVTGCELGGGGNGAYGLYVDSSALENIIVGNRVVSSQAPDGEACAGGFYIASTGNVIVGNFIKSGAGTAALSYGINLISSANVVTGNVVNLLSTGVPINDDHGSNTIEGNRIIGVAQAFRVRGRGSWAKGAGDYITINPALAAGGAAPVADTITPMLTPADAQTRGAGKWNVQGYPGPTATAVIVECDTALTAATTCTPAIVAGTQTYAFASVTGLAIGGRVRVAAGGGTIEDVQITNISGSDVTAVYGSAHDAGTAITPLWTFYYDIGYNDRGNVAT